MIFPPRVYALLDPNIDRYLNPYIPPNPLHALPAPLTYFLGYRSKPGKEPPSLIQWLFTIIATIAGICTVGAVYNYAPGIHDYHPPTIIASLGASAILFYNAVPSPLGQPRNAIVGHTLAAIVGTGISKAFQLDAAFFANYDWVVAAVACASASLAMSMTNTVHPPGGATAILACVDKEIVKMGWSFPACILVASVLMTAVACVFDNVFRQYPTFWWSPQEVGSKLPLRRNRKEEKKEAESESSGDDVEKDAGSSPAPMMAYANDGGADSERTIGRHSSQEIWFRDGLDAIHVAPHRIMMPSHVGISEEEARVLRRLMFKLGKSVEGV